MSHYKMSAILVFICLGLLLVTEGLPASNFQVGSKQNPGKSCKAILAQGGTVTGNYYIRVLGHTLQVFCDQTTIGGGWTLVLSAHFVDLEHFDHGSNAISPRPNWPLPGDVRTSTTPPLCETDWNAVDFRLWKEIGNDFMVKSNFNNWIACSDGTGSLVHWHTGSIECKVVNYIMERCPNVTPNMIDVSFYDAGLNIYDDHVDSPSVQTYYFFETQKHGVEWPTFDPCEKDAIPPPNVSVPRGNIYIR